MGARTIQVSPAALLVEFNGMVQSDYRIADPAGSTATVKFTDPAELAVTVHRLRVALDEWERLRTQAIVASPPLPQIKEKAS